MGARSTLDREIKVKNGTYCEETFRLLSNKKRWECREYDYHDNQITVHQNNRFCFAIEADTVGIRQLNRRGRVTDEIALIETGIYTDRVRRMTDDFVQLKDGVLAKNYRIVLNATKDEIQIYRQGWLRERLVKKIIKTENHLYILNENNRGTEIQVFDNQLIAKNSKRNHLELKVVTEKRDIELDLGK